MKPSGVQKTSESGYKISVRFRNTNIIFFLFAAISIGVVMITVLRGITNTVSKDYARLYSTNTATALGTHLNKEIALVKKAAQSKAVTDWFTDEENERKKAAALSEMLEIISVLFSDNMYLGVEGSLNEYTVEKHYTANDLMPHDIMDSEYFDDAWYFECLASSNDYTLNVDIDKILNRKRVWVNHKVTLDGTDIGVICTGLEFAQTAGNLLAEYDNTKVRGIIIDENGIIQMDSKYLGDNNFLFYEQTFNVADEFDDQAFQKALKTHLGNIDGFFESSDPVLVELRGGQYSYATLVPIEGTNWAVITFYLSSSLFNITRLMPLFVTILVMLVCFIFITSVMSYRLLFRPFSMITDSLGKVNENKNEHVYGGNRNDEFGDLSRTVQRMIDRLASYNADLEKEVAARSSDLQLAYARVKEQNQLILSSVEYAGKIQKNLLPPESSMKKAFSEYSVIWNPRDIVGGDIYWIKSFREGTILCVCDCTGHGVPGALLTMLVVSTLDSLVSEINYKDTAELLWQLDRRLGAVLNANIPVAEGGKAGIGDIKDGCDIAILFVSKDGGVTVSSGKMHVFICDGKEVRQIKGQKLNIGEGAVSSKESITAAEIPANQDNKFYIASDGLFDQAGGELARPFGYKTFKETILQNHDAAPDTLSRKIWEAFENYRGANARRDDVELIVFKP